MFFSVTTLSFVAVACLAPGKLRCVATNYCTSCTWGLGCVGSLKSGIDSSICICTVYHLSLRFTCLDKEVLKCCQFCLIIFLISYIHQSIVLRSWQLEIGRVWNVKLFSSMRVVSLLWVSRLCGHAKGWNIDCGHSWVTHGDLMTYYSLYFSLLVRNRENEYVTAAHRLRGPLSAMQLW